VSDWLVSLGAESAVARARIVALPWAGGGTAVYRRWPAVLPAEVSLHLVRLPGRESRMREAPLTDMDAVVDELAPLVTELLDRPTMIFGYSLGALVAYELTARLCAAGGAEPAVLAVGGCNAPHLPRLHRPLSGLDDDEFVAALRDLQGTPPEVFEHRDLLALLLPALRADFLLLDRYRAPERPPLSIPVVTYSGTADLELTPEGVSRWSEITVAATTHHTFAGGHFFLAERPDAVLELVNAVAGDLAVATAAARSAREI
jgi:medium-chain acyl-[acyl-carrier-protein] hydrolase